MSKYIEAYNKDKTKGEYNILTGGDGTDTSKEQYCTCTTMQNDPAVRKMSWNDCTDYCNQPDYFDCDGMGTYPCRAQCAIYST